MTISQSRPPQLQTGPPGGHPIVQVDADRRLEAIERLVGVGTDADPSHAQQFLEYARASEIDLGWLWGTLDERNRITASCLVVPSPGRTAMLFTSHARSEADTPAMAALVEHAGEVTRDRIHLLQVLLDPEERLDRQAYLDGGFTELAVLRYMERRRPLPRQCRGPQWPDGVTAEPYDSDARDELLEVLDASYAETLDCPGLFGLRDTADIFEGHQATGRFEPAMWTMLRIDGRAAGVLLLNPAPAQRSIELVYLGLAPIARGRGLGRQLLRHGLQLASTRRERTISLAVDEQNTPAVKLYEREGFRPVIRRLAMIRSLR